MASLIPDNTALQRRFADVKVHDVSEKALPSGRKQIFDTPSSTDQLKTVRDASEKHPLTVRRVFEAGDEIVSLEIRSGHIIRCLTKIFKDYDDVTLVGNPVVLSKIKPLVYRFKDIWAYTYDSPRTDQELQDLEKLLAFICTERKDDIHIFRQVEESREVSYHNLWACFKPGEIVVKARNDYTECYKVLVCTDMKEKFVVRCMFANFSVLLSLF
jgi:hypothetical protein